MDFGKHDIVACAMTMSGQVQTPLQASSLFALDHVAVCNARNKMESDRYMQKIDFGSIHTGAASGAGTLTRLSLSLTTLLLRVEPLKSSMKVEEETSPTALKADGFCGD
jgi:hypothetical protein